MKVTKFTLEGGSVYFLDVITFKHKGALPSDTFTSREPEGLGPPGADVAINRTVNGGGVFGGAQPQGRQITLNIGMNPNYAAGETIESLRKRLYRLVSFSHIRGLKMTFYDDTTVSGYIPKLRISSLNPNLFSKDPEMQMVLECDDYDIRQDIKSVVTSAFTKANPFISYEGEVSTGLNMEIVFTADTTNWTITNLSSNQVMSFAYAFKNGDRLQFSTEPGIRSAVVYTAAAPTVRKTLLYTLTPATIWIMIQPADNYFTTSSQNFNWSYIRYIPKYWGI